MAAFVRHSRWISLVALGLFLVAQGAATLHTHNHAGDAQSCCTGAATVHSHGKSAHCCCSHGLAHRHGHASTGPAWQDNCAHDCPLCDFLAQPYVTSTWTPVLTSAGHVYFQTNPASSAEAIFPNWLQRSRAPPVA